MGLPNKFNFNDESKKINTLLSGKAKTTDAAPKADLHTSNLLPPKFLYKSFYDICPQTSFLVTFCILRKKIYSSLFLTVSSALQKNQGTRNKHHIIFPNGDGWIPI